MNRVVVTGMGIVCPLGLSVAEFSERMFRGESGTVAIRGNLVDSSFPVPHAGLVDRARVSYHEDPRDVGQGAPTRFWQFSTLATEEALRDLPESIDFDAILYGSAEGLSFETAVEQLDSFNPETFDWRVTKPETVLDVIQSVLSRRGHSVVPPVNRISINSACATGNQAIGTAFQRIQRGEWNRCVVGGVDARCEPSNLMNFHMLSALTTADVPSDTASRPFDRSRTGFVRGEGAATLILESLESATSRGARIYAEVAGYGNTGDAYRMTDGRDDCLSVIRSMEKAIESAGIEKAQIDYINAHGTSTPLNDRLETKAIKETFGERARRIPVSSLKSQLGHSTVAAGAMESIACILMLESQKIAPTINYSVPDPECDLDYVPNKTRAASLTYVLNNNFGFGGQNACLVFRKWA